FHIVSSHRSNRSLRRLLMRQDVAGFFGARRIDSIVTFLDVLDYSVLVDHERRPIAVTTFLVKDAVVFYDAAFGEVAEDWKSYSVLFRELRISEGTVHAQTEHLSIVRFEFG